MATNQSLEIVRGNDKTWNLVFDDGTDPINITGATIRFTVKANKKDTDSEALIQKTITSHTDAAAGETSIVLTQADTTIEPGEYFYDIQYETSGGVVTTVLLGTLEVQQNITLTTT